MRYGRPLTTYLSIRPFVCARAFDLGQVRVRNLTFQQPFSPVAMVVHTSVSRRCPGGGFAIGLPNLRLRPMLAGTISL